MRKPRWPESDIEDLRRMAGTKSTAEIAEWLGRSVPAVCTKSSQLGIPLMLHGAAHHKALYSEEQRRRVIELRGQGWMFKDIATMLGIRSHVTAAKIWYAHKARETEHE